VKAPESRLDGCIPHFMQTPDEGLQNDNQDLVKRCERLLNATFNRGSCCTSPARRTARESRVLLVNKKNFAKLANITSLATSDSIML